MAGVSKYGRYLRSRAVIMRAADLPAVHAFTFHLTCRAFVFR